MPRQTPIEASDIRAANRNAVGGKRKRCVHGKPCSAACIQADMVCLVDLPEPIAISIDKIRDYINDAKTKMVGGVDAQGRQVVGEFQLLKTPKEAVEWLLAHKEELALWGIDEFKLQSVLKYHPELITVGVEPGVGRNEGIVPVTKLVPEFQKIPAVLEPKGAGFVVEKGSFHDQMAKVNDYKLALETSKYLATVGPEVFGKTYTDRVGHLVGTQFNADKFLKELEESGNIGNGIYRAGGVGTTQDKVARPWDRGLRDMTRNMGLPYGTTTSGLNPSGLYKPDETHGQFGELFKAAGMEDKAGPFKNQGTWVAYAGNAVKSRFEEIFEKANPSLVWVTQNKNAELVQSILTTPGGSNATTFKFESLTNGGKPVSANATFVIRDYPNGERGVIVASNHPGSGFKGSEFSIRPHIVQVARFMKETGRVPTDSEMETIKRETLKLEGNKPVTSIVKQEDPGDRLRREAGDRVIKELVREGKQEKADVKGQERLDERYEDAQQRKARDAAFKLIDEIRRENRPVRNPRVRATAAPTNRESATEKVMPNPSPKKPVAGKDLTDAQLLALYNYLGKGKSYTQTIQEVAKQVRLPESVVRDRLKPSMVKG